MTPSPARSGLPRRLDARVVPEVRGRPQRGERGAGVDVRRRAAKIDGAAGELGTGRCASYDKRRGARPEVRDRQGRGKPAKDAAGDGDRRPRDLRRERPILPPRLRRCLPQSPPDGLLRRGPGMSRRWWRISRESAWADQSPVERPDAEAASFEVIAIQRTPFWARADPRGRGVERLCCVATQMFDGMLKKIG